MPRRRPIRENACGDSEERAWAKLLRGWKCMRGSRGVSSRSGNGSILVIDDAPALKELIVRWLEQNEYRYVFVEDEGQGRKLLARRHFDAVMYSHEFRFRAEA